MLVSRERTCDYPFVSVLKVLTFVSAIVHVILLQLDLLFEHCLCKPWRGGARRGGDMTGQDGTGVVMILVLQ